MMRDSRINFIGEICNILRMPRLYGLSKNQIPGVAGYRISGRISGSFLYLQHIIFGRIQDIQPDIQPFRSQDIRLVIPDIQPDTRTSYRKMPYFPAGYSAEYLVQFYLPNIWCNSTCRIQTWRKARTLLLLFQVEVKVIFFFFFFFLPALLERFFVWPFRHSLR